MTIATYSRQALSVLQALLLCCAPSLVEAASPAQAPASPPQTAAQEDKFELSPRPNPKYAQKISELGEKALADGHLDEALNYFEQAARYAPQDTTLIERIASMRSKLVRAHVEA